MPSNHTKIGAWVNSKMSGRNSPLYGSIFTSVLLVKVVWDTISGHHNCRASISSSPSLTDPFDGIQLVVGTYIKPFLVRSYSETGLSHTFFPVGGHTIGAFPNAAPCLHCSNSPNPVISPYCSEDTPVTIEFATDPGVSTSMSLRYLQAVLGFFQNARCITVGRSSPASARVSGPFDLKECMR